MGLHIINAARDRMAEFFAMTRLCAFPLLTLTGVNCILLLSSQGQELLLSAFDHDNTAKVILAFGGFGLACATVVAFLQTIPHLYTFEDRTASTSEWAGLVRSVYPWIALGIAALPATLWLLILLQDTHSATRNAVRLAACCTLGILLSGYFFRDHSRRLCTGVAFSTSLILPLVVVSMARTDDIEHNYLPLLHNFTATQVLLLVYGYWSVCLAVLAVAQWFLNRLGKWRTPAPTARSFNVSLIACAAVVLSFAVAALALRSEPINGARQVGPLATLLIGLAAWLIPISLLFVYVPRRIGLPSLALAIPVVVYFGFHDTHQIRTIEQRESANDAQNLPGYLMGWLRSREVRPNERFPVVVVAAEGGGIRATYWTAGVLSRLDALTGGRFPRHLFAISSVSGGSFGAALYAAALADRRDGKSLPNGSIGTLTSTVASNDFLSPLVSGLLFNDAVDAMVPTVTFTEDRAAWLERSWELSWRTSAGSDRFAAPLDDLYKASGLIDSSYAVPALFVNATEVNTGRKFLFSNVRLSHGDFPETFLAQGHPTLQNLNGVPLSAVAHASARFPFLSPAATLSGSPTETLKKYLEADNSPLLASSSDRVPWGNVVDGGYLDNSGASTAADLLRALKFYEPQVMRALIATNPQFEGVSLDFYVLIISNDPLSTSGRQHVYHGGGASDWFASYQTAATSPELEVKGRRGLPDRPLEGSAESLNRSFRGAMNTGVPLNYRDLLYPQSSLATFTNPPIAVLNARTARSDAAKSSLAALANEPPEGFFQSKCCDPWLASVSAMIGETNPCRLAPRAFEASLGRALDTATPENGYPSYGNTPPLGWYLRESSRRTLDAALDRLDFQGVDSLATEVVAPYSKGIGNPRLACEVSLATRGLFKDAGVQKYLEALDTSLPRQKIEPISEIPCAKVEGEAMIRNELFLAIQNESMKQAECLVKRGANVNARDSMNNTPLILALERKNEKLAKLLIERGANVNAVGEAGRTALLEAVEYASPSMVALLIKKGADVNAKSEAGFTALMAAASQCRPAIGKQLIRRGADPSVRDVRGYSAREWSRAMQPCPTWSSVALSK